MHKTKRLKMKIREHNWGKAIVMGMLERDGKVAARVVPDRKKDALRAVLDEIVDRDSVVYTDEHTGYMGLKDAFTHQIVNHLETYVNGTVHTQGIENFWSCLKRGLNGTYVSLEPFHLFRYVDEEAFRFNNRKDMNGNKVPDAVRFAEAMSRVAGRRLTYSELTGKSDSPHMPETGTGTSTDVPF